MDGLRYDLLTPQLMRFVLRFPVGAGLVPAQKGNHRGCPYTNARDRYYFASLIKEYEKTGAEIIPPYTFPGPRFAITRQSRLGPERLESGALKDAPTAQDAGESGYRCDGNQNHRDRRG
jgi:hypothetical protein